MSYSFYFKKVFSVIDLLFDVCVIASCVHLWSLFYRQWGSQAFGQFLYLLGFINWHGKGRFCRIVECLCWFVCTCYQSGLVFCSLSCFDYVHPVRGVILVPQLFGMGVMACSWPSWLQLVFRKFQCLVFYGAVAYCRPRLPFVGLIAGSLLAGYQLGSSSLIRC